MKVKSWKRRIYRGLCWCAAVLFLAGGTVTGLAHEKMQAMPQRAVMGVVAAPEKALQITVIDVGKADATLLQYQGHAMLIDTGLAETQDRLLQVLQEKHVASLDAVLLSHPHPDHMGGLQALFDTIPIQQVYDNGQKIKQAYYKNYIAQVEARHIPRRIVKLGDKISLGTDVHIDVLAPSKIFTKDNLPNASSTGITNNNSIICRVAYGDFSMLFTGDAQKSAERQALKKKVPLSANVLKVGHHGSKTSSLPEFVQAVHPDCATISCSRYRPAPESKQYALNTLQNQHVTVYQTYTDGNITICSDGKTYEIHTAKK